MNVRLIPCRHWHLRHCWKCFSFRIIVVEELLPSFFSVTMVKTDGVLVFFFVKGLTSAISYNKRELSYNNGLSSGMIGQIDVTLPQEITTVFNEKENIDK